MGKRQISEMQPNELVVTLLISEIAAIPLQDTTQPLLFGICSIFMLIILEITLSVLAMKSLGFRKLVSGKSVVVIKNGVIDQHAMSKVRVTILDLIELLRAQNVFDISSVAFAVLEVNGNLSVLLKSSEQPATAKDVGQKPKPAVLPLPVISDGRILYESLEALDITENELIKKLEKSKLTPKEVFIMTMDRNKNAEIVKKRDKK